MAFKLGHSSIEEFPENPDINLTPFIDVMLVLLIVFMIAAPLATADIHVDLPSTSAATQPRPDKPVYLTLKADKTLALDETAVSYDGLAAALDKADAQANSPGGRPGDQRIFLRADKTVSYDDLMKVMNLLQDSGHTKVALVGLSGAAPAASKP
jgi:biopolymer transport protein ExbD